RAEKRYGGETAVALEELGEIVSGKNLEDEVQRRELARILNGFLRSLPDRDRDLFLRRYWGVETLEALAKQTGLSVSAVHRRLGKLRERLRDHLQKEGIDP
ncbi:MAG: sigma-70 family RNA polymerase sigma factor, partial [Oscillospiraceae bacterium]|nr:sigma-70 family RNA polymerase sigma factor [Oscillospiraceae bacterium]